MSMVCAVFGYGEVGHACLEQLLALGADVRLVVTHADAPDERIWFPSVRELAEKHSIPVVAPERANSPELHAVLTAVDPDLIFSFYYRQLLPPSLLALAREAALNLHGSLLPRYRGRCPVNWVLIHGERETGVTLHHMDQKADHGDIVAQRAIEIGPDDTALTLTRRLADEGRSLLSEVYPLIEARRAPRTAQDHARASYFGGRKPADGLIDWSTSANQIRDLVRALTEPWPGAFSEFRGRQLMVWSCSVRPDLPACTPGTLVLDASGVPRVQTGWGSLELEEVTWADGVRTSGQQWARSAAVRPSERMQDLARNNARTAPCAS